MDPEKSEAFSYICSPSKSSYQPQSHRYINPLFSGPPLLNKAKTPSCVEPNLALGHFAPVPSPRHNHTHSDFVLAIPPPKPHVSTTNFTNHTPHNPPTRPPSSLIIELPLSSPPLPTFTGKTTLYLPPPPQISQPNTDPLSYALHNKNKRLASEVDWEINLSHSKTSSHHYH